MTRVVLLEDYFDTARRMPWVEELAAKTELTIYTTKAASESETARRLRSADVVITIRDRVIYTPSLLSQLQHVKLLAACGARLTHIDMAAATENGIAVAAPPVAEHQGAATKFTTAEQTWNLILGLVKETVANHQAMRQGNWQSRPAGSVVGRTLGLIGLGTIGGMVARTGSAMHMRVLAWSPHLTRERTAEFGAECVPYDKVFTDADIVSVHAPLLPENEGMIGEAEFAAMKPHAFFVNTARAGLVNEMALRRALEHGAIAGAGLDVFWEEPLPGDHWLRRQENVLLQPHLGGMTDQGYESLIAPAVANVIAFLEGRPKNVVNPEALNRKKRGAEG